MPTYNLRSLQLPRLTGAALKTYTAAVETRGVRSALIQNMLHSGGIDRLHDALIEDAPTGSPLVSPQAGAAAPPEAFAPCSSAPDFPLRAISDYARAYRDGALTPLDVAERFLAALDRSEQGPAPLRAYIACRAEDVLEQARDATRRFAEGRPLGMLDGVPLALKDEIDMLPYPTTVGTAFLGAAPADADSTVAARLRAAGALLTGKTNMHEIGINPNGSNAHWGSARNPYHDDCDTGGSSSGSAVAVAAGLVAAAIGADGGGSIRIPASLCGVVGLKPTFGRVSEAGAAPLCWSVAHLGPLAASAADAALIYATVAGPDPRDANTRIQPAVTLSGWSRPDLAGMRLGIYPDWFEHASPEVVAACRALLQEFEHAGAEVRTVSIPELDEIRIAHVITILSEMLAAMSRYPTRRRQHAPSTRISLALASAFSASDYVWAQRMRTRALAHFAAAFQQVDAIITPATAVTAQPIPAGGERGGWSDLSIDTELMRYAFPSNFTGNPAISFPAGYDSRGLPVGLQAIGRHWEEHILLRLAYNAERIVPRRLPARYYGLF